MNKRLIQNLVSYISQTNGLLEKYAHQNEQLQEQLEKQARRQELETQAFNEKVAEAVNVLAQEGVVPQGYEGTLLDSLQGSPVKVAEFLTQMNVSPKKMGQAASGLSSSSDAILDFCFP